MRKGIDFRKQKRMDDPTFALALKGTRVLDAKDAVAWDWELVGSLILVADNFDAPRLSDSTAAKFLKRMVFYFKPSSNQFIPELSPHTTEIARGLIRILVASAEGQKLLQVRIMISPLYVDVP